MKFQIGLFLAVILISSLFTIPIFAEHADDKNKKSKTDKKKTKTDKSEVKKKHVKSETKSKTDKKEVKKKTTVKKSNTNGYSKLLEENKKLKTKIKQLEQKHTLARTEIKQLTKDNIDIMAQTNPLVKGIISGKLKIYVEPIPNYAAPNVKDIIDEAIIILENDVSLSQMGFKRVYRPDIADIHVEWVKDYGGHTLGQAIFKSHLKVGLGAQTCYGQWMPFDAQSVHRVFFHELGHSLGFGHSNNPNNIMYYETQTRFETDYFNTITIDEGQVYSIPFCKNGSYHYEIVSDDYYNGFDIYVLTADTDPVRFLDGYGRYYSDCSAEKMKSYRTQCNVNSGDMLAIYNKDDLTKFSPINVQIGIVDLNQSPTPDFGWDVNAFEYDETWLEDIWNMYHQ